MSEQELNRETAASLVIVCALFILLIAFSWFIAFLHTKLFRVESHDRGIYQNMIIFPNNGFMGMPISMAIYGSQGFFLMVAANIFAPPVMYTFGIWNMLRHGGVGAKFSPKQFINVPVIASFAGLAIFFFRIPLPDFLDSSISIAGDMMTPLCMMVIGIQLTQSSVGSIIKNFRLVTASFVKIILLPLLVFALLLPFGLIHGANGPLLDPLIIAIAVLNAMMPTAALTVALSEMYGCNVKLASEGAFLTTLFSIATIPLTAALVNHLLGI
jgi:predicted permease